MTNKSKRLIKLVLLFLFFLIIIFYVVFQSRFYLIGPEIKIFQPKNHLITEEKVILLNAEIKRASYITLNDKQIFSDEKGIIRELIPLQEGPNFIKIWVKDRFGKEKIEILELILKEKNE